MTPVEVLADPPALEVPAFAWPRDAHACTVTVLARGGAVREVHGSWCDADLRPVLDRLRGLPATDGAFGVRLAEGDGSGTATVQALVPRPREWKFAAVDAAPGARCVAEIVFGAGDRSSQIEVDPACALTRAVLRGSRDGWSVPGRFDGAVAFRASVAFAAVADPDDPRRTVVLPEGKAWLRDRVDPRYPEEARAEGLSWETCHVDLDVAADGTASVRDVTGCHAFFHGAARDALSQWTYWPKVEDGAPVASTEEIRVTFVER